MDEYEKLVLTDPVAFKFLEDDPAIRIVERKRELPGYELYVVEQWACSREDPTIVITTFTGQVQHKVLVSVLEIPSSERRWPSKLKTYMRSATHHHARKQSTKFGFLMITNLSTFPSTLTILPVSGGDLRGHRELFFVNENLKRLGCSGRAGLTLSQPSESTVTKFRQLYRTSEQVTVNEAVLELVQMCQIALTMFEKLPQEYCDGLLCDITEKGLADWWTEIGMQYYNVEPSEGVLGPSTVAALIGLFLGSRNRLHAWGAPVSKNAYDIHMLKRGIAQFQKARNLPKSRRLDRDTLHQLHKYTAKAATHEGWAVPRAVKSTVAELGKGGEMVMGMVGAKEKSGIADVETTDIDQFLKNLAGERCKWLWRGKPRKNIFRTLTQEHLSAERQRQLGDDSAGYVWENSSSDEDEEAKPRQSPERAYEGTTNQSKTSLQSTDRDQMARRNVLKTVTGRMTDAKSGLGRIRDAVGTGFRGHHQRTSREANTQDSPGLYTRTSIDFGDIKDGLPTKPSLKRGSEVVEDECLPLRSSVEDPRGPLAQDEKTIELFKGDRAMTLSPTPSDDEHEQIDQGTGDEDRGANMAKDKKYVHLPAMRRARSLETMGLAGALAQARVNLNLRHLSYTDLPALSKYFARPAAVESETHSTPLAALEAEQYRYVQLEHMHDMILKLKVQYPELASEKIQSLKEVGTSAEAIRLRLTNAQRERMENSQQSSKLVEETTQEGRDLLTGRLQEIEALGAKLEYELGVLASKIEDVEDGVADLARQVMDLESRSRLLAQESRDHSWHHWMDGVARRLRIV